MMAWDDGAAGIRGQQGLGHVVAPLPDVMAVVFCSWLSSSEGTGHVRSAPDAFRASLLVLQPSFMRLAGFSHVTLPPPGQGSGSRAADLI